MVEEPTRCTDKGSTLIDHVYFSHTFSPVGTKIFVPRISLSDHFPLIISSKASKKCKKEQHKIIYYRDFMDVTAFLQDLGTSNWNPTNEAEDPDVALTTSKEP